MSVRAQLQAVATTPTKENADDEAMISAVSPEFSAGERYGRMSRSSQTFHRRNPS